MKNKFMRGLLAVCMAFTCVFGLAACGEDPADPPATPAAPAMTFTVNEEVVADASDVMADLKMIHNNFPSENTEFTLEEMLADSQFQAFPGFSEFTYYVEIGTVANVTSVDSITVGSKFLKDQTFELSIGRNNHLTAKVYYVEDNKVYVAAPVVVFEAVNLAEIKINDTEFDVDTELTAVAGEVETIAFETASSTVAAGENAGEYDVVVKEANNPILLTFEGVTSEDFVVVKKVIGDEVSYAISEVRASNKLAVYPVPYSAEPLTEAYDAYDGTTREYSIYVLDGSVYTITLNIEIDRA